MQHPLKDRTALVTGASSGIGRAIALALAARGASVCLVGRDAERLAAVAAAAQGDVYPVPIDLTENRSPEVIAQSVRDRFGSLHVLVHSAGIIKHALLKDSSVEEFDAQLQTNVRAPYALTRALAPMLMEGEGDVVFVNSSIVRHPRADAAQFSATQHALTGLADCIRQELNPSGVRVLSLFPGRTATPRQERLYRLEAKEYEPARLVQPADIAETVLHAICLPRNSEITEIHLRPTAKS